MIKARRVLAALLGIKWHIKRWGGSSPGVANDGEAIPPVELWAAVANVKETCRKGPGGAEQRNGAKHFRGGAKVYVIDAFWGNCDTVTVVGQQRKTHRYVCLHMPARHLENFRLKLVYSPAILSLMREHYADAGFPKPPGKDHAEQICSGVPRWNSSDDPK
ncbi:hypothetical protein TA3x_003701 [Tundrisphaera sp. TA3]|uniref:hypothetical protein n=1 Tax=Tundrisphaera sp. TA3 TaxID=3435775 RepID=UPI003EBDEEC6